MLKSGFKIDDRLKWNTTWKKPETAEVDKNGFMNVWYLDGNDEKVNMYPAENPNVVNFTR